MNKFFLKAACIAACVLILTHCKDDKPELEFSVSPTSISIIVGGEQQIAVTPASETYTFVSTATAVATVTPTGLVKGVAQGSATINVTHGKTTKPVSVTVDALISITEIEVTPAEPELAKGGELTLTTAFLPADYNEPGTFTVSWVSLTTDIVSVDQTGKIRALDFGEGKVKVSLVQRPEVYTEVTVQVAQNPITEIVVGNTTPIALLPGEKVAITTSFLPTDYDVKDASLNWESLTPAIVIVDNGEVEALTFGEGKIKVSLTANPSVYKEVDVNVVEKPITEIVIGNTMPVELFMGEKIVITTSFLPLDYAVKDASLKWESLTSAIVSVVNGEVEALATGEGQIKVSLTADPSVYKVVDVNVKKLMINIDISQFSAPDENNLRKLHVSLLKDMEINVIGLTATEIGVAYNRDFMEWNPTTETLTFIGETGEWDIWYQPEYQYFWVARMNDLYPDAIWIGGRGFTSATTWHEDYQLKFHDQTNIISPRDYLYMRYLGNNVYQAHGYLKHEGIVALFSLINPAWGDGYGLRFVFLEGVPWQRQMRLTEANGYEYTIPSSILFNTYADFDGTDDFVEGYYRITVDVTNLKLSIVKID